MPPSGLHGNRASTLYRQTCTLPTLVDCHCSAVYPRLQDKSPLNNLGALFLKNFDALAMWPPKTEAINALRSQGWLCFCFRMHISFSLLSTRNQIHGSMHSRHTLYQLNICPSPLLHVFFGISFLCVYMIATQKYFTYMIHLKSSKQEG